MKKLCSIALIFVLTAALFAGCGRDDATNSTPAVPDTSSTQPTVMPKPELPLPSGTNTTAPGTDGTDGTDGSTNDSTMPNRMVRPSQGSRY